MVALKRINSYVIEHPWRFAAGGFVFFILLSAFLLAVLHRNFFNGLFGAYAVALGWASGVSARRRWGNIPFWQKALFAPLFVGGWLILGWTLQVTGLLPR